MVGGEAQIARSDILVELAISEDLKIDTDMFDELQIIAANNSWKYSLVVIHIYCYVRQCRTCQLILKFNKCLPKPKGFFFVQLL